MANRTILPSILTVEDVLILPIDILSCLTNVTTSAVETQIDAFINYVAPSGDEDTKKAAKKLTEAYAPYKELKKYVNSQDMSDNVQLIAHLNMADINYSTPDSEIATYERIFNEILDGEKKLITLDKDNFEQTVAQMIELAHEYDEEVLSATIRVTSAMKKMSKLFYVKPNQYTQNTRLQSALKFKTKIQALERVINDVKELKNNSLINGGADPRTWRCL